MICNAQLLVEGEVIMRRFGLVLGLLGWGIIGCTAASSTSETWFCQNDEDCKPVGAYLCERSICVPYTRALAHRQETQQTEGNPEPPISTEHDGGNEIAREPSQPPEERFLPEETVVSEGNPETLPEKRPEPLPEPSPEWQPEALQGCTTNNDCFSGFFCNIEQGKTTGVCLECLLDGDCKPHEPVCLQGRCYPCRQNSDCTKLSGNGGDKLFCDASHRCVSCLTTTDCPAPKACVNQVCGDCLVNADCGTGLYCDQGACAKCLEDSHCISGGTGQRCVQGSCVECTGDADCSANTDGRNLCLTADHRCVACTTDQHCQSLDATKPFCVSSTCQACAKSEDCEGGKACLNGVCSACTTDQDCGSSGQCVKSMGAMTGICMRYAAVYTTSPVSARRWSDGGVAEDCMGYRYPKGPLDVASKDDGAYLIQPLGVTSPFLVYCDMTTQGGGWTLFLKADGRYPTFSYDSPYWSGQGALNIHSLDENGQEAIFASYSTVGFSQMMLKMRDANDQGASLSSLLLQQAGGSLRDLLSTDQYIPIQEKDIKDWAALLTNTTYHTTGSSCRWQGLNVAPGYGRSEARVASLRIGMIFSEYSCADIGHSFIGFGAKVVSTSSNPPNLVSTGNFAFGFPSHDGLSGTTANQDASFPGFGLVYGRRFPSEQAILTKDADGVRLLLDGTYPMSCAGYMRRPFHKDGLPPEDGLYWIRPAGTSAPVKAYCQMQLRGGGWTLALKVNGQDGNWNYGDEIWTKCDKSDSSGLERFYCAENDLGNGGLDRLKRDLVMPDHQSARLIAYDVLPFGAVLLQMMPFTTGGTSLDGTFPPNANHVLLQRGASLRHFLLNCENASDAKAPLNANNSSNPFVADAPERTSWEGLLSSASPYIGLNCNRQGFCVKRDGSGTAVAITDLRIGLLANSQPGCDQPDGFIGLGPKFEGGYKATKTNAGNAGPDATMPPTYGIHERMGFVSVREVLGSKDGQPKGLIYVGSDLSTLKDPTMDGDGGYIREDGTIESSCLAYLHTSYQKSRPPTGFYWIYPKSVHKDITSPFRVHCDMDHDGGGWTLILKVGHNTPSSNSAFTYDGEWAKTNVLNETNLRVVPDKEVKLDSYFSVPFTHIMIGMHPQSQGSSIAEPAIGKIDPQIKRIVVGKSMASMYEMMTVGGESVPFDNWPAPGVWRATFPNSSMQRNCMLQGYNYKKTNSYVWSKVGYARFILMGNEQADCSSVDSAIFVGGSASANFAVGNYATNVTTAGTDNGGKELKGFAYFWVR